MEYQDKLASQKRLLDILANNKANLNKYKNLEAFKKFNYDVNLSLDENFLKAGIELIEGLIDKFEKEGKDRYPFQKKSFHWLIAMCFIQLIFINSIFILIGFNLLNYNEVQTMFNIFVGATFAELIALFGIIVKFAFTANHNILGIIERILKSIDPKNKDRIEK